MTKSTSIMFPRVALSESKINFKPGLVHEVRTISREIGLPDPVEVYLSTETISEAVWRASRTECWESRQREVRQHDDQGREEPARVHL